MEIGEPTLLAKLPRAGLSEEGSRWFSQVYGIRDGKFKKRHEVCAAIDGNALNVIEVINGRTVVSWPISPDSYFVSEPYSERLHISNKSSTRRCWCAVQRRGHTTIQYFEQAKIGDKTTSATTSHQLVDSQSRVLKIEPVSKTDRVVIVAQEDGSVTVLPSDGGSVRQSYSLGQDKAPVKLHAIRCMSLTEAKSTLLKGRPDISATLTEDHVVVAAIYGHELNPSTPTRDVHFGVWTLRSDVTTNDTSSQAPLITHQLKHPGNFGTTSRANALFNSLGTKVELHVTSSIITFDLTGAVPQEVLQQKPYMANQVSSIELSHDVRLLFAPGKLQMYNTRYNSLLASVEFNVNFMKRKRDGSNLARLSFIAYFSQIRRVLAYSGSQLLAIDIRGNESAQNPFKQSSLLIGNILRGKTEQSRIQNIHRSGNDDPNWPEKAKQLERLAESRDIEGFERTFLDTHALNDCEDLKKLDAARVDFLISKIFTVSDEHERSGKGLDLVLAPEKLLSWLLKSGLLDEWRIMKALQVKSTTLDSSALPDCLIQADPSFGLLEDYITRSPYIEPSVLTTTIKILISQALETPETEPLEQISSDTDMQVDEEAFPQVISGNSLSKTPRYTPSTVCLVRALQRFALTGGVTVSNQLRTVLDQKEVLALIQFLRQQLFLGGYTRMGDVQKGYVSLALQSNSEEDISQKGSTHVDLEGVVTLLNGCIDCLGIIGVLGSGEDQVFVERLVPELQSEIKNATIAVEDSTYLQGLLRETLRYAESIERQPFEVRAKVERANDGQIAKGKITTIFAEDDSRDNKAPKSTALPLSLKAEEDLSKQKLRIGGQVSSRSVREMGMLKDRLKAPYSFERLVL